eukprot:4210464-Amphidinium_carterae.1
MACTWTCGLLGVVPAGRYRVPNVLLCTLCIVTATQGPQPLNVDKLTRSCEMCVPFISAGDMNLEEEENHELQQWARSQWQNARHLGNADHRYRHYMCCGQWFLHRPDSLPTVKGHSERSKRVYCSLNLTRASRRHDQLTDRFWEAIRACEVQWVWSEWSRAAERWLLGKDYQRAARGQ